MTDRLNTSRHLGVNRSGRLWAGFGQLSQSLETHLNCTSKLVLPVSRVPVREAGNDARLIGSNSLRERIVFPVYGQAKTVRILILKDFLRN